MKGSVITDQRQKASLSANNYFGGKRSEGRPGSGGVQSRSRHFSPASFVTLITSTSWSCEAEVPLPLAEPRLLSDGDWLGPAGTGSGRLVLTVLPLLGLWNNYGSIHPYTHDTHLELSSESVVEFLPP